MSMKYDSSDSETSEDEETILKKSSSEQFLWACENEKLELITKLLSSDASIVHVRDSDEYTPLHRASYANHLSVIKVLLKAGASIDCRTVDGWTPLHCACSWNNYECASLLIDEGADVNATTNSGQTSLHLAAFCRNIKDTKETLQLLLLNYNIDLSIKNSGGETAKQIAIRCCPYSYMFDIDDPVLDPFKSEDL